MDKVDSPTLARLPIGDLLMALDMNNRWVYKARDSFKDCNTYGTFLYHNVLSQVYPIKEKHYNYFRDTQLVKDTS